MFAKSWCLFLLLSFFCTVSTGQGSPGGVGTPPEDAIWGSSEQLDRKPVPYVNVREADMMWSTRIWRIIDLREKINLDFYYPVQQNQNRISLFQLLKNLLLLGKIRAFEFNPVDLDDSYKLLLTKPEIETQLFSIDTVQDQDGNMVPVKNEVEPASIKGYTLKEDWFFDKQRSSLNARILFICPLTENINKNTGKVDENVAPSSLFWLYFPDIRPYTVKTPVFNSKNNAKPPSIDDLFWKRRFSSYIIQQNNVFDRSISAYMKGLNAILESEKIHDKVAAIEHDMWQY